ncbi:MAG: hypothetical protein LBS36_01980 [Oscillospiraceae bacterium]|jgi:hypothetical protein|nr:hypothetical protein [Oscillospiraceae bacterium]
MPQPFRKFSGSKILLGFAEPVFKKVDRFILQAIKTGKLEIEKQARPSRLAPFPLLFEQFRFLCFLLIKKSAPAFA